MRVVTIGVMTALALVVASAAKAQQEPSIGTDVAAAMAKIRSGDAAGGRADLERLGHAGRLDAEQALGEVLLFGIGGPADAKSACGHFERSSATWATGMHDLALCAEQGAVTGVPDFAKAVMLYKRAADMGLPKSKCALGNLLILGQGAPKDESRGHKLCLEAAQAGVADSQADVGNQFLMGVGTARDIAAARHWYELAAAQHQRNAAYTLAEIYWNADGVPRDLAKCRTYWMIAYEAGRLDAALRLGDVAWVEAERGKDRMDPDGLQAAHDWYDKAARLDDPETRKIAIERRDLAAQVKDLMLRRYPKS